MRDQFPNDRRIYPEPVSLLWHSFAAPQTLLALLGLLTISLILMALLPQIPLHGIEDLETWLALQSGFSAQFGRFLNALGLFDISHAFWFRLLLVLVALTLFVRLLESGTLAWRGAHTSCWTAADLVHWGKSPSRFLLSLPVSLDKSMQRLRDCLTREGYRYTEVREQPSPNLVASRRAWSLWAAPVLYGSLLVALVGLGVLSAWGWQNADWGPAPDEVRPVGHGTNYALRLDAFTLQQTQDGRAPAPHSELAWLEGGVEVKRDTVSARRPGRLGGVTVRQVGYVPVARMRGRDRAGQSLLFQAGGEDKGASAEIELAFAAPDAQPMVLVYGHDLVLALSFEPLSEAGAPAVRVAVVDEGGTTETDLGVLYESGSVGVNGLDLAVALEYRPLLRVDHRPAADIVVTACALAVVALTVGWLLPPRLFWIVAGTEGQTQTVLRVLLLPGARGSLWSSRLASRLRGALTVDN